MLDELTQPSCYTPLQQNQVEKLLQKGTQCTLLRVAMEVFVASSSSSSSPCQGSLRRCFARHRRRTNEIKSRETSRQSSPRRTHFRHRCTYAPTSLLTCVTGATCRKLLYVTPELIDTQGFLNTLYSLRNNNKLAMFVVDEVRSRPLSNAFLSKALTCSCSRPTRSPSGDMTSGSPTVSFQSSRSASTAPRCAVRSLCKGRQWAIVCRG